MQKLRDFCAIEIMEWVPPKQLPEGRYYDVKENEELGIGYTIGWRHEDGTFYSNKELEPYEYWRTKNGEIVKAPWGGYLTRGQYTRWQPDNIYNGQAFLLIDKIRETRSVEIYFHKSNGLDDGVSVRIDDGSWWWDKSLFLVLINAYTGMTYGY
ncbi:MAG: hypothetical protein WC503_00855 [Candidatus Shapirobacteria bacterium]